jgi:hypothetical protein
MLLHSSPPLLEAFARVIPSALVLHVAKGTLNRVRLRPVGRQAEPREAGMRRQPPLDRLGLVAALVVHDHIDLGAPCFGVAALQTVQ